MRFAAKVQQGAAGGCWLWTGARLGQNGYGGFSMARGLRRGQQGPRYAHRIAWELAHGQPIPNGQYVLHTCDVPLCVNPAHLFLGTHRANMEDAARKGRLHTPRPSKQKLTSEQVSQIRARVASGERQAEIAKEFGVTRGCVHQIVRGIRRRFDGQAVA